MILLIAFSFLAGIVTILSPCILPILPIVLSSTTSGINTGRARPLGVVFGFVLSFTFFTLFLSAIVAASGISPDSLRLISILVIAGFGASLLFPGFQTFVEQMFSRLSGFAPKNQNKKGFWGGILIGFSVGLLWTPCVGPILASVISLAIVGTVTIDAFLITLAYSLGTAIPMLLIMLGGQHMLKKIPGLYSNLGNIQKAFGVLMILTAIGIFFKVDRQFQIFILNTFPKYGSGLTSLEDNEIVKNILNQKNSEGVKNEDLGKPMFDVNTPKGPKAPEIIPGGRWFNSEPLTIAGLKGKVVIIDFWTYSCINCQRTFPYLREWHKKYSNKGLVIIGVHSPEFEFEKNEKNVETAIADFNLPYPIVQDNDFATWRAYKNRYWPAKYFIDRDGLIRYTHFGEGAYDQSERMIQELLKETGATGIRLGIDNPDYDVTTKTPEIYLGYGRIDLFASPEEIAKDTKKRYSMPKTLGYNQFAFEGEWNVMEEYANPLAGSKLHLNFDAREVFLVMRAKEQQAKIKVYIDNTEAYYGRDNINGTVTVNKDTLYKIIKLPSPGPHNLRLEFEDGNAELYAFTFG